VKRRRSSAAAQPWDQDSTTVPNPGAGDGKNRGISWPAPIYLLYHLVFSTKDREPWLQAELRPRLGEYLSGAIRREGGFCLLANGVSDHVHLLARLRRDKAVSEVLRSIKANSSGWIHDAFPKLRAFHWQDGYGAFT